MDTAVVTTGTFFDFTDGLLADLGASSISITVVSVKDSSLPPVIVTGVGVGNTSVLGADIFLVGVVVFLLDFVGEDIVVDMLKRFRCKCYI